MNENDTRTQEVDEQIDDRDRRALEDQVREADREEALEILDDYDPFIADGGVTVREAAGDCEILEDESTDPWKGAFHETDKYGNLTGAKYYKCRDCGREVHEDVDREHVSHREGCRFDG